MRWSRASLLASPTVVPASTVPWRWIAPVRARIASSNVVLPLWNGPTSAMHRGPVARVPFCAMNDLSLAVAAAVVGAVSAIVSGGGDTGKRRENRRNASNLRALDRTRDRTPARACERRHDVAREPPQLLFGAHRRQ